MSVADQIKARLDIVDIISNYAQLKKAGRNFKAPCPFHQERTPSFVVFPDNQTWRCFGQCGEGGDIFSFIMKAEGMSFGEALRELAQRAGIPLETNRHPDQDRAQDRLYTLVDETARFFQSALPNSPAHDYIIRRGLTTRTIEDFRLGYAPDSWDAALGHLTHLGFTVEEVVTAGVAIQNEESGRTYDRFRHRFIIPICDARGRVLGFGARALSDDQNPKYLNSPQSDLFDKSQTLFGFDQARRAIRETETAVMVEGYLDVIQAHQAGYKNVVGTMGTALTSQHIQTLSKYAGRLVLALDSDTAGIKATMRGLEVARQELGDGSSYVLDTQGVMQQAGRLHLDIRILQLPHGKDPDEFIRQSPQEWPDVVGRALTLAEYLIQGAAGSLPENASVVERQRVAEELLPLLLATEDKTVELNNLQLLSLKLRLDSKAMVEWARSRERVMTPIPAAKKKNGSQATLSSRPHVPIPTNTGEISVAGRARKMEQFCLTVLLKHPQRLFEANRLLRELSESPLEVEDFTQSDYQAIFELLLDACRQDEREPLEYVLEWVDDFLRPSLDELFDPLEEFSRHINKLHQTELRAIQQELSRIGQRPNDEFPIRVLALRRERLGRQLTELQFMIEEAQQGRDGMLEMDYAQLANQIRRKLQLVKEAANNLIHGKDAE